MVYNAYPQCGKRNHHKVRCAECGLCLRAGRAGWKPKVKKSEQKFHCQLVGPVCKLMYCVPLVDTLMMFVR